MNAMDLQLSVFQRTGVSGQDILSSRRITRSTASTGVSGGTRTDAPSFSDVLAALTRKNESPRTAPFSDRLRATESAVAANAADAAARALPRSASASQAAEPADTEEAAAPALDISTKEARAILRNALSADTISSDLLSALTDANGDISDALLDLIFAEDEEDETDTLGLGSGDVSEQLTGLLTDARQAQELLSTQSGRELITAMSERSLAGLVTA